MAEDSFLLRAGVVRVLEATGFAGRASPAMPRNSSTRCGAPRGLGTALIAAAEVVGGELALARLEEAVTVLEASPARLVLAQALAQQGALAADPIPHVAGGCRRLVADRPAVDRRTGARADSNRVGSAT